MRTGEQEQLAGAVQASWRCFLDTYEPLRPELYRYCRHLTRSPWDAEDMTQEALARAFVSLAMLSEPPHNPRAWLFRVASNLWLNRVRQAREVPDAFAAEVPAPTTTSVEARATREAAGTLIAQLAPQERAAVVLKDAFGLSLEEVAEALSTTSGAIKSALQRGRAKLVAPEPDHTHPVMPAVLDAFCDAFNARDLDRLTALLLDTTTLEYPGFKIEYGADAVRAGSLQGTLFGCPDEAQPLAIPPRCELRTHRGDAILLWWSGDEVHAVVRVDVAGDRVVRLCNYYHAPEVITEVCRELDVPFQTHGYRPGSHA
jgi:RNA polymerase sigma-70 factor (ECF subfamily)